MVSKGIKLGAQAPKPAQVFHAALVGAVPWLVLAMSGRGDQDGNLVFVSIWAAYALLAIWAHLWSPSAQRDPGIVVSWVVFGVATIEGWFAFVYWAMANARPVAFSEPVDKVGAAYFAVSTATTTGMGDIHPVTDSARLLVTAQMVVSLFLIVLVLATAVGRFFQAQSKRFEAFAERVAQSASTEDPPS